jgi:hypothetical protein
MHSLTCLAMRADNEIRFGVKIGGGRLFKGLRVHYGVYIIEGM